MAFIHKNTGKQTGDFVKSVTELSNNYGKFTVGHVFQVTGEFDDGTLDLKDGNGNIACAVKRSAVVPYTPSTVDPY